MIVWYLQSTNIVLIREDHTDKIVLGFVLPTFLLEIYLLESRRESDRKRRFKVICTGQR